MKTMQKQNSVRKWLAVVLVLAMLASQLIQFNVQAATGSGGQGSSNGPVTLASVTVNGQNFILNQDTITLGLNLSGTPTFELYFSNNVQNEAYLQANLEKISIINEETNQVQPVIKSASDKVSNGVLCVQAIGLGNGSYRLVVEPGVTANAGSTQATYTIHFTVGPVSTNPDDGEITGPTNTVYFNVTGVVNTPYFVMVQKNGVLCSPMSDGSYQLADGQYTYVVSASGYVTQEGSFSVSGADKTISITLVDYVLATFNVTPSTATVRLKYGQEDYIQPYSGRTFKLTPGLEYTYVVEANGYTMASSRIVPIRDETYTIALSPAAATLDYTWQGNGGNSLMMTTPSVEDITVKEDTSDYAYNVITSAYESSGEISFDFTMSAGINNFNESSFLTNNMDLIAVYQSFQNGQPVGTPVAQYSGGTGALQYCGFANRIITIGIDEDVLQDGTYVLVFGQNICGNNVNKTIGKKIAFEFTVGEPADENGTTTTVVDEKTGTVTETTVYADGSSKIVVTETNGTVTTTVEDADGNTTKTVEKADGSYTTVETLKNGTVTTTTRDTVGNVTNIVKKPDGSSTMVETLVSGVVTTTVKDAAGNTTKITEKPDGSSTTVETLIDGTVTTTVKDAAHNVTKTVERPDGSYTITESFINGITVETATTAQGATSAVITLPNNMVNRETEISIPAPLGKLDGVVSAVITKPDGSKETVSADYTAGRVYVTVTSSVKIVLLDDFVATGDGKIPFVDVAETDWFYSAVAYVYENDIMNGVSTNGDIFAPQLTTSRAMIATILYRLEGEPAVTGGDVFTDVSAGTWYTDAVRWASANDIVKGGGDGTFAPNKDISREQLAVMLYRYAVYKGVDVSVRGNLSSFTDGGSVSSWAVTEMEWAVGAGILQGNNGAIFPNGDAKRCEAATMFMRFCEDILN